ncbi:Uncharacterised protein [Staphylococcus hominis]|nr:Uncharacterised protein [Staphylococcus hominis]
MLKKLKIALLIVILAEEIRSAKELENRLNYLDSEMTKLKVIRK